MLSTLNRFILSKLQSGYPCVPVVCFRSNDFRHNQETYYRYESKCPSVGNSHLMIVRINRLTDVKVYQGNVLIVM